MNVALKFWNWTFRRSPQNADQPNVQPKPIQGIDNTTMPTGVEPVGQYIETESILGGPIKIGLEEGALKGPNGELIRARNVMSILLGCHHLATQFQAIDQEDRHIRGIAGKCIYCESELQELLAKGEIAVFDAERLSLVCTDCGKITESGQLCCPKHYTTIPNPDGTSTYLAPEDVLQQERQKTVTTILGSLVQIFGENTPNQTIQDNNND